jgi:predicted kinase
MILFTAGQPYAGKSELVKCLVAGYAATTVIDPSTLRPPEYDQMTPSDQANARIAAWEVSLEMLTEAMNKPNKDLVIFDTCAAKTSAMLQQFVNAKAKKHTVFYVFVGAPMKDCQVRAGKLWPKPEVIQGYSKDFQESVPKLRKACDRFLFVKNVQDNNRVPLKQAATRIIREINEINRIPKPVLPRNPVGRAR